MADKILLKVLLGRSDKNIKFSELTTLLERLVFDCRIKGDHFIYFKSDVDEIINIQPNGKMAKSYQVKQIRNIITKYHLGGK